MSTLIRVSDLKQYPYCPRIIYWTYCCPVEPPATYKMEWGKEQHTEEEQKELRRTLDRFGLKSGEKRFGVQIFGAGLSGKLDLLIITDDELIPVEYKYTRDPSAPGHYAQLYGYALALKEQFSTPVKRGFLWYPRLKEIEEVSITPEAIFKIKREIAEIKELINKSLLPKPATNKAKCEPCEFNRFCNDVW